MFITVHNIRRSKLKTQPSQRPFRIRLRKTRVGESNNSRAVRVAFVKLISKMYLYAHTKTQLQSWRNLKFRFRKALFS